MGIKLIILLIAGVALSAAPMAKTPTKKKSTAVSKRQPAAAVKTLARGKAAAPARRTRARVVRRRARVSPSRQLRARYVEPPLSSFPEMAPPLPDMSSAELRDSFFAARVGRRVHQAIDIMRPEGTPLYSCVDGFVEKLGNSKLGGIAVYLTDNEQRHRFFYAHLSAYAEGVTQGMPVLRGQLIGYVGKTGNARHTGPHLHLQILQGSRGAVNPYPVLRNVVDGGLQSDPIPPASVFEQLSPSLDLAAPVPTAIPVSEETVQSGNSGSFKTSTSLTPASPAVAASGRPSPLVVPDLSVGEDNK